MTSYKAERLKITRTMRNYEKPRITFEQYHWLMAGTFIVSLVIMSWGMA